MSEVRTKLATVRDALARDGLAAVRLRGVDWFAWATAGGSNSVLLSAEEGVAEVLVTATGAFVLTDVIEAERLRAEEVPDEFEIHAGPWQTPVEREQFVRETVGGGAVGSDRPRPGERPLPTALVESRWSLLVEELERYRSLGRDAAAALTLVLGAARPDWTERALAGAAAEALSSRGILPALVLGAGERRVSLWRHPLPTEERLGAKAMVVVCGRRHGLFANLTRFVFFRPPDPDERRAFAIAAEVERAAWDASRPGASLGEVYERIRRAYARAGAPGEEDRHHQGGPCGYLSRDLIARPGMAEQLRSRQAIAWNPSLPGAKREDTAVVGATVEVLTTDPRWPTLAPNDPRPDVLVR